MRHLLLLRHTESVKNVEARFAEREPRRAFVLTATGERLAQELGKNLARVIDSTGLQARAVYSSGSERAIATADQIARMIGARVSIYETLSSIGSGVLAGKTESEAERTHSEYIEALRLYRAGVLNSYDIPTFSEKEDKLAFESRIRTALGEIVEVPGEELKIMVAHRSPITAILIDFARRFHSYPSSFFGHIQLDLGRVSWIEEVEAGRWRIRQVNTSWNDLKLHGVGESSGD